MEYPDGEFDLLFVVEFNFFLEVAGIDGFLLFLIELVANEFDGDGCFSYSS